MAKLLAVFVLGGSFVFGFAFAQEEECPPPQPVPECLPSEPYTCDSETQYRCQSGECGAGVLTRSKSYDCQDFYKPKEATDLECPGTYECIIDKTEVVGGPFYNEGQTIPGQQFKQCSSGSNWSSSYQLECQGACYPTPEVQTLQEQTLSPKNVFDVLQTPKLPVNIGWNNNVEQQLSLNGGACQVSSYQYKVKQGPNTIVSEQTGGSSHNTVVGGNSCELDPNSSYSFEVRSCAGETCSQPGTLSFSTSSAPQLLSPYDPDFQGIEGGISSLPVTLRWCPHPEAKSYKFSVYRADPDTQERKEEVLVFGTAKDVTTYIDSLEKGGFNLLSPLLLYEWEVQPCKDSNIQICGIQSQAWRVLPGGELEVPNLRTPFDGATVNMQDSFSFAYVPFASRYVVEVSTVDADVSKEGVVARKFVPANPTLSLQSIWGMLNFNSSYSWRVAACGGAPESAELSGCGGWSKERSFITTGKAPLGLDVSPTQEGRTAVPVTFDWDDAPGAASYRVQLGEEQSLNTFLAKESHITLDYPALGPSASEPGTAYEWRVKTCADIFGSVCGGWSQTQTFRIAPLKAPTITKPGAAKTEFLATTEFAWTKDFGSNFFAYQLNFLKPSAGEKSSSCQTPPAHPTAEGLPEKNSVSIRLRCLGQYEFRVAACADKACEALGPETTLKLDVQSFAGKAGGLIPCDTNNDNPATIGLDEREPCELKHLFLLVRNLVDFALWRLSLVILVAMTAFTGFTMYTSFGGMEVASKVKSIWKAVGVGFLILLFAWLFLNLLLGIVGFQVNIFGKWHELVL